MKAGDFGDRFPAAGIYPAVQGGWGPEESDSVMNQKKLIQSFLASREDLELEGFYVDDGFTGTNFERPGFQRMLRDIRGGKIRCVVVKDLSRFGRDYIEAGRYLERLFPEWGVRFISVIDQIDSIRKPMICCCPLKIFLTSSTPGIYRKKSRLPCGKNSGRESLSALLPATDTGNPPRIKTGC